MGQKEKYINRTLISACGCKGWLWLWLWLSFAVPVFSKDALLRGGGQLRDMFDMSYQPGPPRAPLGLWDWKAPWTGKPHGQMMFLSSSGGSDKALRRNARSIALWSLKRLGMQVLTLNGLWRWTIAEFRMDGVYGNFWRVLVVSLQPFNSPSLWWKEKVHSPKTKTKVVQIEASN